MISAVDVKALMNEYSKLGKPFLFGVDFEMERGFFIDEPLETDKVYWRIGDKGNFEKLKSLVSINKKEISLRRYPVCFEEYKDKIGQVIKAIKRGDSFLTNLTIKTPIETDCSFEEIFVKSNSVYSLLFPGKFVCFSPETFVKIENDEISSNPMKGTIKSDAEDAEKQILNDVKEAAEHFTIVDFIRNELSRVANDVRVERLRYIDKLKTSGGEILQVSSEIKGTLFEKHIGEVIFNQLPAGSVSGAPKPSTLNIIAKAEGEKRGYYCGVFGYFDGKNLDSAVMIRYIEADDSGNKFFRSGGGITSKSTPEKEYEEVINKIYLPFV